MCFNRNSNVYFLVLFGLIWTSDLFGLYMALFAVCGLLRASVGFLGFYSNWGRVFEHLTIIVRISLKINLTYSVIFRFLISSKDSMEGPLSNSKLLQVILDTLKPDTQAPRITSMEASLCKSSSKTSTRFRDHIRDYF